MAQKIREVILDEVYLPGEHLRESELAEKFNVSRSPVREALLALEKEGTVIISPYKGATVKPLAAEEALDIAALRLALISLILKPAYATFPGDSDHASNLAKRLTRVDDAKQHFEQSGSPAKLAALGCRAGKTVRVWAAVLEIAGYSPRMRGLIDGSVRVAA